jgi:hypothetical protein
MGYAIFPLRSGGSRLLIDPANVVVIKEDPPADNTGLATMWVTFGPPTGFFLAEAALVVFNRLVAAAAAPPGNIVGP